MTARAHQVEDAQVLEAESIARRHGRACHFLSSKGIERRGNMSITEYPIEGLFLDLNAFVALR